LVVLHPFSNIVFWFQFEPEINVGLWDWMLLGIDSQFNRNGFFQADIAYMLFGALMSLFFVAFLRRHMQKIFTIRNLTYYLEEDIKNIISQGENANLEFKSSFRWDYRQNKMNRDLEKVILKSLAGFLNGTGGTLIIGLDDQENILGLENDYQTFKKKNKDGFELALIDLINTRLGVNASSKIGIFFHKLSQKEVCRVIVEPTSVPIYLKDGKAAAFYIRSGASTRNLNVQDAVDYIEKRF